MRVRREQQNGANKEKRGPQRTDFPRGRPDRQAEHSAFADSRGDLRAPGKPKHYAVEAGIVILPDGLIANENLWELRKRRTVRPEACGGDERRAAEREPASKLSRPSPEPQGHPQYTEPEKPPPSAPAPRHPP